MLCILAICVAVNLDFLPAMDGVSLLVERLFGFMLSSGNEEHSEVVMKTVPTSVTLDETTKKMLEKQASAEDRSRSAVVCRAIRMYVDQAPSFAGRHGAS